VSYWNAYVAVTQMHGQGNFFDPRLNLRFVTSGPDLVSPKLAALREYQLSLASPSGTGADEAAAARGRVVFEGAGRCSSCHTGPNFTDAPRLHAPSEVPVEGGWAARSATGMYRTTPLAGVSRHPPYFHDGSAPTLAAVVGRYDSFFHLGLTSQQKTDLVAYLETL
jgi:mono/diheme cytochrome c family protein